MDELTKAEREALLIASHTVEPVQDTGKALFALVARIKADAHAAGVAEGRAEVARIDHQATIRGALHGLRGHTFPDAEDCAPCDQDADQLARALTGTSPQGEGER